MVTSLEISVLQAAYLNADLTPSQVVNEILARIDAYPDPAVWISLAERDKLLERARELESLVDGKEFPLYGIPFAIKDNIDAADFATTAGCPDYAYLPQEDATAVRRLLDAGAILVGKTNLDQFATGLVGTRSPYGAPRSVFSQEHISGGSSSGSAVAVAAGLVSFSLGTDTAGSGRVPASFNNLVGVKPSKGLVSARGVVPACRSLDCVTVFAASCGEADLVRRIMQGYDAGDPYTRKMDARHLPLEGFRFGVLPSEQQEFFGDHEAQQLYLQSIARLQDLGGEAVTIDYRPFKQSAELLYGGPWVAERTAAVETFLGEHPEAFDPTVRGIIEAGRNLSAVEVFKGAYRLHELQQRTALEWAKVDVLLLPTAPTIYRVAEVEDNPLELNSRLGTYTNFVNLLDCCAVAIPAGFRPGNGLPFGVTLVAPAFCDDTLACLADRLHRAGGDPLRSGGTPYHLSESSTLQGREAEPLVQLAVVGAHLSGQPLNFQLTERGASLLTTTRTASDYQLYALTGTEPLKPGLLKVSGHQGEGLEVEVWALTAEAFGAFTAEVPAPLGIGSLTLADGSVVKGFICEPWALEAAADITHYGGWRNYLAERQG